MCRAAQITAIAQQRTERRPRRRTLPIASACRPEMALRSGASTAPTFEGAEGKPRGGVLRVEGECPRQRTVCGAEALLGDQRLGEQQVVARLGRALEKGSRSPLREPRSTGREPAPDRPAHRLDVHPEAVLPTPLSAGKRLRQSPKSVSKELSVFPL